MRDLIREEADKYQDFFNFMNQEHNLTLTISEMNEIIIQAQKLVDNLLKPDVSGSLPSDDRLIEIAVPINSLILTVNATKYHNRKLLKEWMKDFF